MDNKPLVSVIMIFLNAEKFIEEAIESVIAQTYDNWELLLVNDGSTDRSKEIALNYAGRLPERIRYFEHGNHQNYGTSASRNLGIQHAKGKYIAFLDADDVWLPKKLEQQVAIMESRLDVAMVYGRTLVWHSWAGTQEEKPEDHFNDLGVIPDSVIEPPKLSVFLLRNDFQAPTTCNALIRAEVFDRIGMFEEDFRSMYEDKVFFIKIFLNFPVYVADQCWAKYRQHSESCCFVAMQTRQSDSPRLAFLNWLEGYLMEKDMRGTHVWRVLEDELWPYRQYGRISFIIGLLIKRTEHLLSSIWWDIKKLVRIAFGRSFGSIKASPNPIINHDTGLGTTTLSWRSKRTEQVEVHVIAPDGPLLSRTGPSGGAATGKWVYNGMVFFLQDISHGQPLTFANTIDAVKVYFAPRISDHPGRR